MPSHQQIIKNITSANDSLGATLSASPFENDAIIDDEFFFKEFFVEDNDFTDTILTDLGVDECDGISIQGFSGTGKTSFLNSLLRNGSASFAFCNIDCADHTNTISLSTFDDGRSLEGIKGLIEVHKGDETWKEFLEEHYSKLENDIMEKSINNAITTIIRKYLLDVDAQKIFYAGKLIKVPESVVSDFLSFLIDNWGDISRPFQKSLKEQLDKLDEKKKEKEPFTVDDWDSLLNTLEIDDAFLFLFLYLGYVFRMRLNSTEGAVTRVITFDNVDALPSLLLHEQLQKKLLDSVYHWKQISQKLFPGTAFKLILLVRDSNSSAIDVHRSDRTTFKTVKYRRDKNIYRSIVKKRLDFYAREILEKLGGRATKTEEQIVSVLQNFIEDEFYGDVLVPAFNMDYRKMIPAVYNSIRKFLETIPSSFVDDDGLIKDEFQLGFRGAVLFDVLNALDLRRFFERFERVTLAEGYCLTSRMLLTLILNKSGISSITDIGDRNSLEVLEKSKVRLTTILHEAEALYSHEEILETLTKLALSTEKSPYLVSFSNRKIEKDWFTTLLKDVEGEAPGQKVKKIKEIDIKNDEISITPAGVIFLKDLITHYEFYSKLARDEKSFGDKSFDEKAYNKPSKEVSYNDKSLFSYSWKPESDTADFRSITSISNTLKKVRTHNTWMLIFYNGKVSENIPNYLNSDFALKYVAGRRTEDEHGQFHIARIVSSHIEYLDNFRKRFLEINGRPRWNEKLIEYIEDYINLLASWKNDDRTKSYIKKVRNNIKQVKDKKYELFDTDISVKL